MRKLIPAAFLLFVIIALNACMDAVTGEGPVTEQSREVPVFNKVAVNVNATILVTNSNEQKLVLKAQKNILDVLITRVDGKTLVITTRGTIITAEPIVIEIHMSHPEHFEVNGSGDLISQNSLENELIDFEVNGSGSVQAKVKVNQLTGSVSGSGTISVSGIADDVKVQINGSGEIEGSSLECKSATVKVNGSGDVVLNVADKLDVTINGSGNIRYIGNPKVRETINGSGQVTGGGGK